MKYFQEGDTNTVKTGILCCEMGVNVPRPLGVLFNHAPDLPYHASWTFPRGLDLQHHGHAPVPHSHVAWVYTTMTARHVGEVQYLHIVPTSFAALNLTDSTAIFQMH